MCSALCKDSSLSVLKLASGSGIALTVSLLELTFATRGAGEALDLSLSKGRLGVSEEDMLTLWEGLTPASCCS